MAYPRATPELAEPADLPGLVVTCAAAFTDDPMIRWPMPDATPAMLQELFRVILTPYLELSILCKIHGCAGAAAWLPPGVTDQFDEIEQSGDLVHANPGLTPAGPDTGSACGAAVRWPGPPMSSGPASVCTSGR